jgi:DNA-binding transcriptional LysR family regulator
VQLAVAGLGVIRLGDIVVGEHLRTRKLVPLLADAHHVEPVPMHALYLSGRHRSPKVVAMVDFLLEHFSNPPWRLPKRGSRSGQPGAQKSRSQAE